MSRLRLVVWMFPAVAALIVADAARAQSYPNKHLPSLPVKTVKDLIAPVEIVGGTPQETSAFIKADTATTARIIKEAGIRTER